MATQILTVERLRELLHYDSDTGVFTWRVYRSPGAKKGDVAGCVNEGGYIATQVDRKHYLSHRLAWLYVYGAWPIDEIDHKDGNPANNHIANLRDVTRLTNSQNLR